MSTLNEYNPSPVVGDYTGLSVCVDDISCTDKECSGGYGCSDIDGIGSEDRWPPGTPKPNDDDKVPKKCNPQPVNRGNPDDNPFVPLTDEEIRKLTTSPWTVEFSVFPNQPKIKPPTL